MSKPPLRTERPVSLWTRIVALISFVLIAGTLVTGALSLTLLYRTLISTTDEDLQSGTADMVAVADPDGNLQFVQSSSYAPVDFVVEIRDANGQTVGESFQNADDDFDLDIPHLSPEQIRNRGGEPFTVIDSEQNRWRVLATLVGDDGNTMFVALPLKGVDSTMREMALVVVLVSTFVVLVGMGAGGYMAHRALEPLRDVEAAAGQIMGGDLSRRVPVTDTSQEVHALSVSLNNMLVRLEYSFAAQAASEERATASEARMRRFVGDASHELRTPLAAIRGFGELYRMGALRSEEDTGQAMRRIEDEARRMGSLVESLLRLARLDENPEMALEELDITDALFDAAQDLRALDPSRQVMVVSLSGAPISLEPHLPIGVMGDEPSLRQVVLNLVGNANRHTPKGSPVEIAVGRLSSSQVAIEVRDHGEGISEEDREKVFERFYRTDSSRQRTAEQGGGAGLGLSIAAGIVHQHRGTITVVDTPGGGSTFRVELQAVDLSEDQAVQPDQVRDLTQAVGGQEPEVTPGEDTGAGHGDEDAQGDVLGEDGADADGSDTDPGARGPDGTHGPR